MSPSSDDIASSGLKRDRTDVFALAGGGNEYLRAREVRYPFGGLRVPLPRFQAPIIACSNDDPRTQSLG